MQVSVETLNDLERRVTVQVPAERVANEIQDRLLSLSRRVKVDGFRPGKVPMKMIQRLYGDQVRYEAVTELMENSLHEALVQQQLNPLGGPRIEPRNLQEGQDLEYSATFEVMPEFQPTGFDTITVERPVAEVADQDVDDMIQNLRRQRGSWNVAERPAREGDRVRIDFTGRIDGEEFPGGKAENTEVVLGQGTMLKDFETPLHGLSAGAETEFDLTFPADYGSAEIAGKTARFHVRLHAVEELTLPEVDDEFAAAFDVQEGGIAALRQSLRENMERELRDGIKNQVKRQVMQGLLKANTVPLPRALVEAEIENLARQLRLPMDKDDERSRQLKTQLFDAEARRRVALGLIISRIATTQQVQVGEQQVHDYLQSVAATYQDPGEVVRWYEKNPQAMESVRALVLEDQIVDWLLQQAQVTETPSTFAAVMAPPKPAVADAESKSESATGEQESSA